MIETTSGIDSKSSDENQALSTKAKFDHSKKKPKETRECYHCNKKGHLKRDCRKLKAEMQKPRTQQAASASTTNSLSLMMASNNDRSRKQDWFADSGASHMTMNRDWFYEFETIPDKQMAITVGNSGIILYMQKVEALFRFVRRLEINLLNIV